VTTVVEGSTPFEIRAERSPEGELRLWLAGDLDQAERDVIVAELDQGAAPAAITIDLTRVGFVGSAGLSALIHACRLLESANGLVTLVDPPANVINLLDTCQITHQFAIQLTGD
jgi:anti-anti-sigma factor